MFNAGGIWRGHLALTGNLVLKKLPSSPTVIEIGCGEGHFLRGLASQRASGRFMGFDPNVTGETGRGVEFNARYFLPLTDVPEYQPDLVIIRHVLEHLTDPADLIEQLAWGASQLGKPVWLFAEMPCIDRVLQTGRLSDFYFEHPSQFTTESFHALLQRGGDIEVLDHGYGGEVVFGLIQLGVPEQLKARMQHAHQFNQVARVARKAIGRQLDEIAGRGRRVAIWGGTGKGAAFMHQFGADAERFPLVVDSDPDKVGTFVPGTGQRIEFRDALKGLSLDVLIIPTSWRARDIVAEMEETGIGCAQVLIEHEGNLVDYFKAEHPYR
jgi:hypothetical protein